jgi:hypothetical protein
VYKAPEKAGSKTQTEPGSQPHPVAGAHAHARAAMADPEMRDHYEQEAERTGGSAYFPAYTNYFKVCRQPGK